MKIKPECRVCGTRVDYMGQVCDACGGDDYESDELDEITRADTLALMDRASREDY